MSVSTQSRLLELRVELWRARSQAKQKWLEQTLSQPPRGPREAVRRARWVKRALYSVDRRQNRLRAREALLKVYGETLTGLERILNHAAEQMKSAGSEVAATGSTPQEGSTSGRAPGRVSRS